LSRRTNAIWFKLKQLVPHVFLRVSYAGMNPFLPKLALALQRLIVYRPERGVHAASTWAFSDAANSHLEVEAA